MKTLLNFAFVMIVCSTLFSQNYTSSPFITLPGDNYDFSITSPFLYGTGLETYITWVNKNDDMYTIYIKKISPEMGDYIIIARDTLQKSNPHFNYGKLFWEQYKDNKWQIWFNNFENQTPGTNEVFVDSLNNDPQLDLGQERLAWIRDEKLMVTDFKESNKGIVVDSLNCSSPDIDPWSGRDWAAIVYEKGLPDAKHIYRAEINNKVTTWQAEKISNNESCLSPAFGFLSDKTYQIFEDPAWSIVYEKMPQTNIMDTIRIENNNLLGPVLFDFDIPTMIGFNINHPYYVIFEKDSIADDASDIYIHTFYFDLEDSLIRISDLPGKNYQPDIGYIYESDSIKVAIFWINDYNDKKDIWIAKSWFQIISDL